MENELTEVIHKIVDKYHVKNEASLAIILEKNPELIENIIKAAETIDWVYFSIHTFDGWYCIQNKKHPSEYNVYYQERGSICGDIEKFSDQHKAIATVIFHSGYLNT